MKMQKENFYDLDVAIYHTYIKNQNQRHALKINKQRQLEYYSDISNKIQKNIKIKNSFNMICLGVRNNWERDCFRKLLNINVNSLDVAESSKADYIIDFNNLDKTWENKWDIVFSNSLDHAIDATNTFYEWIKIVKNGGLLIIGLTFELGANKHDCCCFDKDEIEKFLYSQTMCKIIDIVLSDGYMHYFISKL